MPKRRLRKRQGPTAVRAKTPLAMAKDIVRTAAEVYAGGRAVKQAYQSSKVKLQRLKFGPKTKTQAGFRNRLLTADWTVNDSNGIKYKNVGIKYKPSKRARGTKLLSQPGRTYQLTTGGSVSAVGLQGAENIESLIGSDLNTFHQNLNEDVAPVTGRVAEQFLFTGSKTEVEFMNCSPTTMELEIYCLIDKTTQISSNDPMNIWTSGIGQEAGPVASVPVESRLTPWVSPTEQKQWNINFWTKKYKVTLTSGEKAKFTYSFMRNRIVDLTYCANFNLIRGISHRMLVVHRGTLVDADNAKTFTAGNQSLSETKLVWLKKTTLYGRLLSTLPKLDKQIGLNIPTVLGAQWHIDEDTGEPENAATTTEFA